MVGAELSRIPWAAGLNDAKQLIFPGVRSVFTSAEFSHIQIQDRRPLMKL